MAVVTAVTQMLAVGLDTVRGEEMANRAHQFEIKRSRPADGQRQSMGYQREALGHGTKLPAEASTDADPVLRRDFEEIR